MKITNIRINDFRGIKNVSIDIYEMLNFMVSDNNVGKTRILEAINQFYIGKEEADIEITYSLTDGDKEQIIENIDEIDNIINDSFIVHYINKKYIYNDNIDIKKAISNNLFGEVIYIPAVSNHENEVDISKTTTNISKAISKLLAKNDSLNKKLEQLNKDLNSYIDALKDSSTVNFEKLNHEIMFSNIKIDLSKKEFDKSQILKNNMELKAIENGEVKSINQLGTGVQRNIVNAILKYGIDDEKFTIVLYDEPETFLNVKLQRKLISDITNNKENTQYIISTHSPDIIYRSENIFKSIIKLKKVNDNNVEIFQYKDEKYKEYINQANLELKSKNKNYKHVLKQDINKTILAWWDRNRVNALFEDKILIIEGATEEIFIDIVCRDSNIVYISSAGGKFSIPYLYILFNKIFGIEIVCVCDRDNECNENHKAINEYIIEHINKSLFWNGEFENQLNYNVDDSRRKPQIFLEKYFDKEISKEKIEDMKNQITNLYNS